MRKLLAPRLIAKLSGPARLLATMRKDRGFGHAAPAKDGKGQGCFMCGNPGHMARDCPDRFGPRGKGKGKGKLHALEMFAFQGGKKGAKGKPPSNHMLEEL